MLIKTRGIVFRNQKYGETSVILDVYTEERGLQSYIVHGVRTSRARVHPSLVQVLSLVELVSYSREDKALHNIKEIRPAYVYASIPFDLKKGAVGLFMVEVARKSIREVEENRDLFEFLYQSFVLLDEFPGSVANFHLHFLVRLASFLGFQPDGEAGPETPLFDMQEGSFVAHPPGHVYFLNEEHSALLSRLLTCPADAVDTLPISREARKALLRHLLDYYRLHIEHFPVIHSYQVLETVF
jgi:DNA repair protein RecO (recombination protein O)